MPEVVEIKGVGPVLAKACTENGFESVSKIAAAMPSELVTVPGVSDVRAKLLIDAAKLLLNGSLPSSVVVTVEEVTEPEGRGAKKKATKKKKNDKSKKSNNKDKNKKKNKKKKKSKKNKSNSSKTK